MRLNELLDLVSESINAKLVYPFNGGKIKSKIVYHVFQNKRNDKMIVAIT